MVLHSSPAQVRGQKVNFSAVLTAFKGLIVGVTMMVPGVSGGSMAMILGVYDDLISSVSSFLKNPKGHALFLGCFAVPALFGMVLFAEPLLNLIEGNRLISMYFFMGAVAGSIPMIYDKAKVHRIDWKFFVCIAAGIALVSSIRFLPDGLFSGAGSEGVLSVAVQLAGGVIVAVSLILPGISVSYMLVVLGLYESTIRAIGNMDIISILPLAIGCIAGIILTTKILEMCMKRYPFATYLVILGFIIGSVAEVYPGLPKTGVEWALAAVLFAIGFICIYLISRREEEMEEEERDGLNENLNE